MSHVHVSCVVVFVYVYMYVYVCLVCNCSCVCLHVSICVFHVLVCVCLFVLLLTDCCLWRWQRPQQQRCQVGSCPFPCVPSPGLHAELQLCCSGLVWSGLVWSMRHATLHWGYWLQEKLGQVWNCCVCVSAAVSWLWEQIRENWWRGEGWREEGWRGEGWREEQGQNRGRE